jgi:hypothetical protein
MSHSEYLSESLPIVVYDADSDLIVAIQGTVNAYDVDTDTWTNYSEVPSTLIGGSVRGSGVYDPVSGLIVVRSFVTSEMWAYDVETDTWTSLPQGAITPPATSVFDRGTDPFLENQVHVYDADTDRIVLYLADNSTGRGIWEGAGTEMTWTYNLRSGEWAIEDTVTPELNFGWFMGLGKAAYDETLRTPVAFSDGVVARYDAGLHNWTIAWENTGTANAFGAQTGPLNRMNHTVVYDPTNHRVIVFGGNARMLDQDPFFTGMDDAWVFDGGSGTWTEILASPTS